MLHELRIPRMGSVENARLVEWRVAEGDAFAEGDLLYEIETDKTTTEVEATSPGILARRLAAPGDELKVGDQIGWWAQPGTSAASLKAALDALDGSSGAGAVDDRGTPEPPSPAPDIAARPISLKATGGARISPLARRLAAQLGVDVAGLAGSGAGGKITGEDVRLAATAVRQAPPETGPAQAHAATAAPERRASPPPVSTPAPTSAAGGSVVPHSLRRKTIARRMTEAGAVPSLTADMEIDLTALLALRKRPEGQGASILGLIAHEAVGALLEHPRLNAHWGEDALTMWSEEVHLGIAVDTIDGLVVPVIRNAERLSARGITAEIARLAQSARDGTLASADLEGGTFTISNPGSIAPVLRAEALLNVPQVALLGLPGIARVAKPVPDGAGGWAIAVRQVLRAGLTFDHRALDGGPVNTFLNTLKARVEAL